MTPFARSLGLGLLLAGIASAGWQPIDSITSRTVSDITTNSNARSVACDAAGNIHVVWRGRVAGVWQPWYSYRNASTGEWSPDAILDTISGGVCDPTCVVGPDRSFYVGWNDSASGTLRLLKCDTAGSWSELDSLAGQQGDSMVSPCADSAGTIHAVWRGSDLAGSLVCYASHSDAGWGIPETLTTAGTHGGWPSVACGHGDTLMAVWVGSSGQSIVSRLRAAGTWLEPETVYDGAAANPCVTWGADSFYAVWLSGGTTKHVLVRARSASGWSDTTRLNGWRVEQPGVSIAAETGGALHVVWLGLDSANRSYPTVQYRHRPAGDTWYTQQFLDTEFGDRLRASVSAFQGRVQVAWSYSPTPGGGTPAVRLRRYERLHDVGVMRIVQPVDTVDSGAVVQPTAWVKNFGEFSEADIPATFRFGGYEDQKLVPALAPGETDSVVFDADTFTVRGWNVATCSTGLAGDANRNNDAVRDSFFVRVQDVGVDSIVAPDDTVYDPLLTPRVRVQNRGNVEASAVVHVWVADSTAVFYHDSVVCKVEPESTRSLSCGAWQTHVGVFTCRCSVACAPDAHPEDNTLSKQFWVVVSDVGVTSIIAPVDTVDSARSITPQAVVRNFGATPVACSVLLRIDSAYRSVVWTNSIGAGDTAVMSFDTWQAIGRGTHVVRCSTMLAGDRDTTNDTMVESVFVRVRDAASVEIISPAGIISGGEVRPRVRATNLGNEAAAVPVRFKILKDSLPVYIESLMVSLSPGASIDTEFPSWYALSGTYVGGCSTALVGDMRPDNDTLWCGFRVESLESTQWKERAPVPLGPGRRPVKDGGSLVAVAGGLLALKGANTREWYRYSAASDSWTTLADMPLGVDGHKVRAGASLCWDGTSAIFALKGTGTREFWRYDIPGDSWHALASLPEHTRGAKFGSGLAFVPVEDTDKVFMVKGGNTREFLVYWVRQNEWHSRRSLPAGPGSTPARHGTCLALLGDHVFCLKGGTTEFYEYFPDGDSWFERADLPRLGRGNQWKKPAKGAALVSDGSRFLYVLKGGWCSEFWRYDSRGDSWLQLDDIPKGNRRRKVGRGGALTWFSGRAYALKGGGSSELWSFDPLAATAKAPQPGRDATVEAAVVSLPVSQRAPGFVRCGRLAQYPVPEGTTTILVIDAAGRVVARSAAASQRAELRFSRPGVYFVVMTGDSGSSVTRSMAVR